MANQERYNSNWEGMLKRWSLDQRRTHRLFSSSTSVYDNPALSGGPYYRSDPPWRGEAQKYFTIHEPGKYYDIADRIFDITASFRLRGQESESEDEDEDEDEGETDVKGEGDDEAETDDKGEGGDEDEEAETDDKGEGDDEAEDKEEEEEEEEDEVKKMKEDKERKMKEDEMKWMKHKEDLLDELKAYVEFIDVASVLHSDDHLDDCLYPFLRRVLRNKHDGIRAKGTELVTTMVQNNPTSQQLVMDVKGLQLLLHNFSSDPGATSRTKTLGAISALIQNNEPGVTAFRRENGYAALRDALSSKSVGLQRDALNLIQYLLHENCLDCNIVSELKLPCIMMQLASSDDAEVREAALGGLLVLTRAKGGNSGQLVKTDYKLMQLLWNVIEETSAMASEDLASLREKGLLVLPGEDAPAPDVASKLIELPLIYAALRDASRSESVGLQRDTLNLIHNCLDCNIVSWLMQLASCDNSEVREAALVLLGKDINSLSEKKEDPMLLGFGSPSAATYTVQSNSNSKRRKLR